MCRIGQKSRCDKTRCEWKKAFSHYCWLRNSHEAYDSPAKQIKVSGLEIENKFKTANKDSFTGKIKVVKSNNW
jgi:hypothetical protein